MNVGPYAQKPTDETSQQHEGRKAVQHFTAWTERSTIWCCVISPTAWSLMGEVNASAQAAQLSAQTTISHRSLTPGGGVSRKITSFPLLTKPNGTKHRFLSLSL